MNQAKGIYDHYFKYDEITSVLKQYAQEFPEYCRLSSIGTTPGNREIWLIEITDPSTGTFDDKPGFAVTANIHAGEVTGNCCAMYFLDTIFANLTTVISIIAGVVFLHESFTAFQVLGAAIIVISVYLANRQ